MVIAILCLSVFIIVLDKILVCKALYSNCLNVSSLFKIGKYWLHQALLCFSSSLEHIGSCLVILKANGEMTSTESSLKALKELIKQSGARTVLANALYEPWLKERDDLVVSALQKQGVECRMFHSYCLRDPYSVTTEGVGLRG